MTWCIKAGKARNNFLYDGIMMVNIWEFRNYQQLYQNITLIERPFAFQSSQGHRNGTAAAVFCSTASVLRLANAKRWCRKWSPICTMRAMRAMMGTPLRSGSRAHQCRYKEPGIWQGIHRPVKGPRMALATDWNSSSDSRQTVPTWQTHRPNDATFISKPVDKSS